MAVLALLVGLAPSALARQSSATRSFELRLDNINRAVKRLARDFAEPVAVIREHPLETRIIEAKILFEVRNYEGASVLLLDLVQNPRFQTKPEYPGALLMLGQSMKNLGNLRASSRYLKQVVRLAEGKIRDTAQFLQIDMALDDDDDTRLRAIVDSVSATVAGVGSPKTRYAYGKALIRLGRHQRAVDTLTRLLDDDTLKYNTRYYLGAAYTALKRYDQARAEFDILAGLEGSEHVELRHLSMLAIGRIDMEEGDLQAAALSYQRVPRSSPQFEVALYEMSWTYIKAEQYDKALATIDTLLLIVKDPDLDIEAHSLRGRLNIFLSDYDRAVDSFEKIVGRFAPIRNELLSFTRDEANIGRYFG